MEFKLIEFNPRRAARGAEGARVQYTSGNQSDTLWMSVSDIKKNIKEFGKHPELLKALEHYASRQPYPLVDAGVPS